MSLNKTTEASMKSLSVRTIFIVIIASIPSSKLCAGKVQQLKLNRASELAEPIGPIHIERQIEKLLKNNAIPQAIILINLYLRRSHEDHYLDNINFFARCALKHGCTKVIDYLKKKEQHYLEQRVLILLTHQSCTI